MEKTKRQKNAIIIYFLFYLLLLLGIIYIAYNYVYPKIIEIEKIKDETSDLSISINKLKKEWLTFDEFMSLNKKINEKNYINELLKNLDIEFYNKNLVNSWELDYIDFINKKKKDLDNEENKKILIERDLLISSILPYFSENYTWDDDKQSLSNLKFVSYIETLLETFNLKYSNSIWIKNINILEDYSSTNSLETNIYSIPVKLSIEWKKTWIINFLHYIENVWKLDDKNNNIENIVIYKDDFLSKNNVGIRIEWDAISNDYNIYKHQIIDIENIKIPWYIDSSNEYRKWSFTDFIKETQWNDIIDIDVDLLFYVKWYPQYKLEQLIINILDQYDYLIKKIDVKLKDINKNKDYTSKFNKINNYLKSISNDIKLIKVWINTKKENLDNVYKNVIKYKYIFDNINKILNNGV